jgi:hypothetical protein
MLRGLAALVAALVLLSVPAGAPGASAWSNNDDNYGPHDWILDQALRVMGGAPAWLNRTVTPSSGSPIPSWAGGTCTSRRAGAEAVPRRS